MIFAFDPPVALATDKEYIVLYKYVSPTHHNRLVWATTPAAYGMLATLHSVCCWKWTGNFDDKIDFCSKSVDAQLVLESPTSVPTPVPTPAVPAVETEFTNMQGRGFAFTVASSQTFLRTSMRSATGEQP